MKLALFSQGSERPFEAALYTEEGLVPLGDLLRPRHDGQATMVALIDNFDSLKSDLQALERTGVPIPFDQCTLLAPLPRPGKIVNCIANYWEHAQRDPRPLNMFLKSSDTVIGPGDTIRLPEFEEPWSFMHEAELAIVYKGPSKKISQDNWRDAVFGFTCGLDITARGDGRATWKKGSWLGKSFDTFGPIGPCIVTADEIDDPNDMWVQLWNNDELRHNYNTDDMEHPVPEIVSFVTQFMTMNSGDISMTGTNHEGLGFIQDGEKLRVKIHGIGEMELNVEDPLKRSWERGVYMGEDSTNHDAVRRHRPDLGKDLKQQ